jgi:hypothetical protein
MQPGRVDGEVDPRSGPDRGARLDRATPLGTLALSSWAFRVSERSLQTLDPPPQVKPGFHSPLGSPYTWMNSIPVSWQKAFQSAAWWPRFITSWWGPPAASHPLRHLRSPDAGRNCP